MPAQKTRQDKEFFIRNGILKDHNFTRLEKINKFENKMIGNMRVK